MTTIYLDHQATTPIDPRVLKAMLPWMAQPANPHAAHALGRRAAEAVETARRQVAELVGVHEREVLFTGGATEAANIALRSLPRGTRVLTNRIEHACVLETLQALLGRLDVHFADVDADGMLDPDELADRLDGFNAVVAMAVNNEIGTVQPLADIAAACRLADVDLLTDVTQAVGRIPLDLAALSVRAAWLSSHKIYGPQGIGALIWRGESAPEPLATGGGQERGIRPGTVPTALAVGFGAACEIAGREMEQDARHAAALAERMISRIRQSHPDAVVNGSREHRVPHNLNVAFPGIDADALVGMLPGLAISTGSACSSGALGLSHVLTAIATDEVAASSIRMGFGRTTTVAEVDAAAKMISEAVDVLVGGTLRKVG